MLSPIKVIVLVSASFIPTEYSQSSRFVLPENYPTQIVTWSDPVIGYQRVISNEDCLIEISCPAEW